MLKKKFFIYLNTVKYYKINQIYQRAKIRLRKKNSRKTDVKKKYQKLSDKYLFNSNIVERKIAYSSFNVDLSIKDQEFYQKIVSTTMEILEEKKFTFLNSTVKFIDEINWEDDYPSILWGYNLNYFDYLLPISIFINVEKDETKDAKIKNMINWWLEKYDYKHDVTSNPYVVSLRLLNFLYYILLTNNMDKKQVSTSPLIKNLYMDFMHLSNNLEFDIRGNHLLKNLKALLILGYFFGTKKSIAIAKKSEEILLNQLNEQILEDGGHFERSTMYHAMATLDLIEIVFFLRLFGAAVPNIIETKLALMLDFLEVVTHPDGEISLFNDSSFNITAKASDILFAGARLLNKMPSAYAKLGIVSYLLSDVTINSDNTAKDSSRRLETKPDTGYFSLSNSYGKLIFDCGDLAPDYLPAHAHNDMLSFELSLKDRRYIVDTGVFEYQAGIFRDQSRSTLSHNTVAVNGKEQSEQWSSFRMARRGRITHCDWKEKNEYNIVSAARNQYDSKKALHRRTVIEHPDGFWLILDRIQGTAPPPHLSHLHFSPGLYPKVTYNGIIVGELTVKPFAFDNKYEVNCFESRYFPEFGLNHERKSLRMSTEADFFGYILVACPVENIKITIKHNAVHLSLDSKDYELEINTAREE